MSTKGWYTDAASFAKNNKIPIRTTIESAFYGNNVKPIDLKQVYEEAKVSPGTVELTGLPIHRAEDLGLPSHSNVLLFNDGAVTGRCAAARRIIGQQGVNTADLASVIREAVYGARYKTLYRGEAIVGLDEDLMVKAHILIPKGFENNLLSWLVNFQYINDEYRARYANSRPIADDGDIFIFTDPDWTHPDYPLGLAVFSPEQNCAAVLGMRYFGEIKKGTLTLAWGIAARNGYASCHGGLKRFTTKDKKDYVLAVFGLSGSGKSTITHAKHNGKYDIMVLHDDALAINVDKKYAIAMEPAYFDKVQDYPIGCEDNKYLITLQNCGVTVDEQGKTIVVTEDVRNGNGRAMKSRYWSPNRVDRIDEPLNAICWLMKDPTVPPILRLTKPSLAAMMGATLATKRTTAERLAPGVDINALVIESYANPFRTYPLAMDYERFKKLIADGVDCFILNTGDFMGKKIPKEMTLNLIEQLVDGTAKFVPFGDLPGVETVAIPDFPVNFDDDAYISQLYDRYTDRLKFIRSRETEKGGMDVLPADAEEAIVTELKAIYEKAKDKSKLTPPDKLGK
ncbi:phosphoenolpyruvate carboxykinase [Synergistales bacterium]|nr:phosphoenolpyruvate carboxykinase [Synergistales bacterium]GHV56179.1 phosphoenolpyruvate carboxykinase [Synergistales bacterium]